MNPNEQSNADFDAPFKQSRLYQQLLSEREEILKHKWLESEKTGRDIGYEYALIDWIRHHREKWKATKNKENEKEEG